MIKVREIDNNGVWDEYVLAHDGHPLQLWAWGELKASHGWRAVRVFVDDHTQTIGAAQLLIKPMPWPLVSFVYCPRGPVGKGTHRGKVLAALEHYVKQSTGAFMLSIEPHWTEFPQTKGWVKAHNTILLPRTIVLDLAQSDNDLMSAMTKKTRQYVRKSEREALVVKQATSQADFEQCLDIYKDTAMRAGFALHSDAYYFDLKRLLGDHSPVFMAIHEGEPVAFLWLAISESVAFELYGGVTDKGQELRANYMLKWAAIQTMKKWGIAEYDMNGLLNDGVSTFKQGFASHETELVGTYDKALSPLYVIWAYGLPLAKKTIRTIKSLRK